MGKVWSKTVSFILECSCSQPTLTSPEKDRSWGADVFHCFYYGVTVNCGPSCTCQYLSPYKPSKFE